MTWSFSIGRLFGSEIRVHATFFLLLLWIGAAAWIEAGPAAAMVNTLFILALFACVVAHEFGHALVARRFGISTPDITLLPIGGLARLDRMPEDPRQEIAVALAGPAVNIVIWLVLAVFVAAPDLDAALRPGDTGEGFFARLAALNLFLAVFNLIPAFPMDGGRVFRALLSIGLGRPRATEIAARAGHLVAFLFAFWGLTGGNPLLLLIAVFVFIAASAESADVLLRESARSMTARSAMITSFETLAPGETLSAAANSLIRTTQHEFPVVDEGELVGFLPRQTIFAAFGRGETGQRVEEVMETDVPRVDLHAPLNDVLDTMAGPAVAAVAVVDRTGAFLGYITRENIGELMVVRGR
ncbi:MAG: site-2 protease family protein [Paracoccaceae bacterium]|nr:site-2 protease family protein [Paracoccaceae bacterium]